MFLSARVLFARCFKRSVANFNVHIILKTNNCIIVILPYVIPGVYQHTDFARLYHWFHTADIWPSSRVTIPYNCSNSCLWSDSPNNGMQNAGKICSLFYFVLRSEICRGWWSQINGKGRFWSWASRNSRIACMNVLGGRLATNMILSESGNRGRMPEMSYITAYRNKTMLEVHCGPCLLFHFNCTLQR